MTVLICTPTYALRLAEVAEEEGINLREESSVRVTIHAGEPGASLPATRERIEIVGVRVLTITLAHGGRGMGCYV